MSTLKEAEKAYKKGEDELKTSVFQLKFNPDYLNAVSYFEKAGKLFVENKSYDQAINAYKKALECNKKLVESYSEALNYLKIAEIYTFNKGDFKNALSYLKESQISFKVAGKYNSSIKVMIDFCSKIEETNKELKNKSLSQFAVIILEEAWTDSLQFSYDKMIRIEIDGIYSKLLDIYMISKENFTKAINMTITFIKFLKADSLNMTKPYHILNAMVKLVMLRLIDSTISFDDIINEANGIGDYSIASDIEDFKKFCYSIKERDNKTFSLSLNHLYHLFEKNLIKEVRKAFDKYLSDVTIDQKEFLGGVETIQKISEGTTIYNNNDEVIHLTEKDLKEELEKSEPKAEDYC